MVKKFQINFTNKWLYFLISVLFLSVLGVGVWAYGTSNPSVMGHSYGELGLPTNCANGQVLKYDSATSSFICGDDLGGTVNIDWSKCQICIYVYASVAGGVKQSCQPFNGAYASIAGNIGDLFNAATDTIKVKVVCTA